VNPTNRFLRLFNLLVILCLFLPATGQAHSKEHRPQPGIPEVHTRLKSLAAYPDLNVAYIERTPRYDYDAPKNQPAPGDTVTFHGYIANRGGLAVEAFVYNWSIDGTPVHSSTYSGLAPGQQVTLTLNWKWQPGAHTVKLELDPSNLISEVSELNNTVEDSTNALAVGFWVERSVYDWFNVHQVDLGIGSVSWDDWAQRQLRIWNQMFAEAQYPLTPQGVIDRVRLDRVNIIPDGEWEDCANAPRVEDKTVDLVWGFTAESVGVAVGRRCPSFNFYIDHPEFQNYEPSLLHELSHARYLIDLYGLNQYVNERTLAAQVSSQSAMLEVDRDVENDANFPLPAYLAVEGELVICASKSGNQFLNCARGVEGTMPRSHSAGASIHTAAVRLQDGHGNLIQGSPALPTLGDYNDHIYYNRNAEDMMGGGDWKGYKQYSAFALNRIAGRRPVCGNYNAPCNIGEYLNDLPSQNLVELRGDGGQPLPWVRVEVYQGKAFPIWYGRVFMNTPDAVFTTNAQGQSDLGAFPFGPTIEHTYGHSNALLLLKFSSNGEAVYRFFEVTQANEAFWSGQRQQAVYRIDTSLSPGKPSALMYVPLLARELIPAPVSTQTPVPPVTPTPTITPTSTATPTATATIVTPTVHSLTVLSSADDGEVGNIDCETWQTCRNAAVGSLVYSSFEGATVDSRYDSQGYHVKRVYFKFDTSSIPANATIQAAELNFYAGPYQNGPNRRLHVVQSSQGTPLSGADFSRVAYISGGSADLQTNTWETLPLNATGLAWITRAGTTKLALVHDMDLRNLTPTSQNDMIIAMFEDSAHQPYLWVQYSIP
jgi:hypothetical protein